MILAKINLRFETEYHTVINNMWFSEVWLNYCISYSDNEANAQLERILDANNYFFCNHFKGLSVNLSIFMEYHVAYMHSVFTLNS